MSCGDKLKNNCGKKGYSTCIYHESDLPLWSSYQGEKCVVVQELIDELYQKIEDINGSINMLDIQSECEALGITYDTEQTSLKDLLTIIVERLAELVCAEQDEQGFYENDLDISKWDLSTDCYTDDCNPEFKSLSSLLKKITEQQCSNCVKVEVVKTNKTFTAPLPDVIIIDEPGDPLQITLPVDFCSLLKVRVLESSSVIINGTITIGENEYSELVYDGTKIIELVNYGV